MRNEKSVIRTAEILCVGTELLLGDIVNTNASFLSKKLAELGINVYRQTSVGDNPDRLSEALFEAIERADLIITSGGLGPTYDDLTKETVAEFFGRKMILHEESLTRIKEHFAKSGRYMPKNNEKQAMMPEGAVIFKNDHGTAPALAIEDTERGKTVIMLPGPPRELCPIFDTEVMPYLLGRTDSVIFSKNLNLFGIGESSVEEKIKDIMTESKNPTVAPYCKEGEVRLRITAKCKSVSEAEELCDRMVERIENSEVGGFIYGCDVDSIEEVLFAELKAKGLTLATAESCTGGLVAKRITDLSGSSAVFLGGAVTYSNESKIKLLGVKPDTLERYGAVSSGVAMEMARGIREALGSDVGVSTTGIAGPDGGSEEKPVGTVFVGISSAAGDDFIKLSLSPMRSRDYIRIVSSSHALMTALTEVKKLL